MQKIVIVANGAAYGSESLLTACAWQSRCAIRRVSWSCASF